MRIKIWGCRGSIPVAMPTSQVRHKLQVALRAAAGRKFDTDAALTQFISEELPWAASHTFGGNTSCVQVDTGGPEYILCDLGSGVREFGVSMMMAHGPARPQIYNIFMSHVHWDHIMGFPFFPPAYIPGNKIRIYSCHPEPRAAFLRQQSPPCFPVHLDMLSAGIEFIPMRPGETITVAGAQVRALLQNHEGDSYAYRFEKDGKSVVYTTDSEHKTDDTDGTRRFAEFFRDAGLVIFDAQYSLAESVSLKEDWGHSSNVVAVDLCHQGEVKHLLLYHHEPASDDNTLYQVWQETIRYEELVRADGAAALKITSAYDGMELHL